MRKLNTSLVGLIFVILLLASTSYAQDETVSDGDEPQSQENDETRSLTGHTLAFEEMYLRTYFSMSMNMGKGKGKGISKPSGDSKTGSSKTGLGKGKGKGTKTSKASKVSKSSKGSDKKVGKSKKNKGGGTIAPTGSSMPSTVPSPSAVAPSTPVSQVPVPTLPPNTEGNMVLVTPYSIFYTIEQTRIPTLDDYSELGMFTSDYLNVYFQVIFAEDPAAGFVSSITEVTGSDFRLGQPTRVDFATTVSFAASSESVPSVADLDTLLRSAFEGENAATYSTAVAAGLDETNIFSTTTQITFDSSLADGTERRVGIVTGITTFVFLLLLGGAVIYRSREEDEEMDAKLLDISGHNTVSDGTYSDDATLQTYEQTHCNMEEDDESTVFSSGAVSRASNGNDMPPQPRWRPNTVPPDFDDDDFSDSDSVGAASRANKQKETPAERQKRLENVAG